MRDVQKNGKYQACVDEDTVGIGWSPVPTTPATDLKYRVLQEIRRSITLMWHLNTQLTCGLGTWKAQFVSKLSGNLQFRSNMFTPYALTNLDKQGSNLAGLNIFEVTLCSAIPTCKYTNLSIMLDLQVSKLPASSRRCWHLGLCARQHSPWSTASGRW